MRVFWLCMGWLAIGLGLVGAALPLLPTVPFMLVAAFCFARSSPELDRRLLAHSRFGPHIRRWRDHGVIPRRAKIASAVGMSAGLGLSALSGLSMLALAGQATVMALVSVWVWGRPETAPGSGKGADGGPDQHEGPA